MPTSCRPHFISVLAEEARAVKNPTAPQARNWAHDVVCQRLNLTQRREAPQRETTRGRGHGNRTLRVGTRDRNWTVCTATSLWFKRSFSLCGAKIFAEKEPRIALISRIQTDGNLIRTPSHTPNFYGIENAALSVPIREIRGSSLPIGSFANLCVKSTRVRRNNEVRHLSAVVSSGAKSRTSQRQ